MNPLIQIWDKWCRRAERIKEDLITTVNDRVTFEMFGDIVRANAEWIDAHGGGAFTNFFARQYVRATAMGIRRHCKDNDDSCSVTLLLGEMREQADHVTRAFYDSKLPLQPGARDWRRQTFGSLSDDGQTWSTSIIDRDLSSLAELSSRVETFADKVVAHVHKTSSNTEVTFGEIFQSVDRLDELFCKYYVVLTGSHWSSLKAGSPQNWSRLLSIPFVDPSKALQRTAAGGGRR
jgi:hypothetical protein